MSTSTPPCCRTTWGCRPTCSRRCSPRPGPRVGRPTSGNSTRTTGSSGPIRSTSGRVTSGGFRSRSASTWSRHEAGAMRVSEIMTKAAVTDQSDDTLAEAARKMWKQQTGSLLVIDGDDLVGILTERDILKAVATESRLEETRISEVMSKDVVTVGPQTSLREAAKVMADRWLRHLPVIDGGQLLGV